MVVALASGALITLSDSGGKEILGLGSDATDLQDCALSNSRNINEACRGEGEDDGSDEGNDIKAPTPDKKPYNGPDSGTQLYIDGDASNLPQLEGFGLKKANNMAESSCSGECGSELDDGIDLIHEPTSSRCQAYYSGYYVSYDVGIKMDSDGKFTDYPTVANYIHPDTRNAKQLYNNYELAGQEIESGSGKLRISYSDGSGENQMYGDLLCANPDNKDYAEWHLCYSGASQTSLSTRGMEWECNTESGNWEQTGGENFREVLTTPYDTFEEPQNAASVLSKQDDNIVFRPGESSGTDRMIWHSSVPENFRRAEFTVNFRQTGHLAFSLIDSQGWTATSGTGPESISEVWTDVFGENLIRYNYPTHDYWDTSTGPSDIERGEETYDYETGQDYQFVVEDVPDGDSGHDLYEWRVNDRTIWSGRIDGFDTIVMDSWSHYGDEQVEPPVVTIKDVEFMERESLSSLTDGIQYSVSHNRRSGAVNDQMEWTIEITNDNDYGVAVWTHMFAETGNEITRMEQEVDVAPGETQTVEIGTGSMMDKNANQFDGKGDAAEYAYKIEFEAAYANDRGEKVSAGAVTASDSEVPDST